MKMIVAITCEAFMCYNIQTKDKKVFHSSKVNIQSFFATLMFGAIQKVRTLSRGGEGEGGTQKTYKSVQGEGGGHAGMYVRSQSSKYKIFLLCLTFSFPLTF